MSKATPGPWKVGGRPLDVLKPNILAVEISSENCSFWLAAVQVFDQGADGNGEANARLIAAAPDLLAACQSAIGFCVAFRLDVPDWQRFPEVGELFALMRAAIAKTEGRNVIRMSMEEVHEAAGFCAPLKDNAEVCAYPVGRTTCGYTRENHHRADGLPMNHEFTAGNPAGDITLPWN